MRDRQNRCSDRPRKAGFFSRTLWILLSCLLAPVLVAASFEPAPELDVDPPVILVLPTEWSAPAAPVVLRARISDSSGVGQVTVWVMGESDLDYQPFRMQRAEDGGYISELSEWDGRGAAIVYYVEAFDRLGNGPRRSAGPGNPFVLRLVEEPAAAAPRAADSQREIAVGLLLAPLALLWLMYRQDRGQRERKFWIELLEPLADLRGARLATAIDGACVRSYRHPSRGDYRPTRTEMRHWIRSLRETGELQLPSRTPRQPEPWRRRADDAPSESNVIWLPSPSGRRET